MEQNVEMLTVRALKGCARCHERHDDVEFEPLTHPVEVGESTLTHWAPCPTGGQPILLGLTKTD